jgi:sec-independent protein translocase protein TatB
MFGVDSGELFIILLVAIVVIGPKELPRVMRTVGSWVGKARGMANQFRSGVDQMVRDSEIAELEKKWREQNEAIMRANPLADDSGWGLPPPPPSVSLEKETSPPAQSAEPVKLDKYVMPVAVAPPRAAPRRRPIVPALVKPAGAATRAEAGGEAA